MRYTMFRRDIQTRIEIQTGIEHVWQVLTNFAAYQEWNPMIRQVQGEAQLGSRLKVYFQPTGRKRAQVFRPKLITVLPNEELRWMGWPRFPGILDIDHYWILSHLGDNRTHLLHGTGIMGLLAPIVKSLMNDSIQHTFNDMNFAHKARAEALRVMQ